MTRAAAGLLAACAMSCGSAPSPRWQSGGAQLAVQSAYWSQEEEATIEVRPGGEVFEEDQLLFRIDSKGRVSDAEGKPAAVLMPDGYLVAEDDALLGWIGAGSAFRSDRKTPSVYMFPTGQVFVADADGEWFPGGHWVNCDTAMLWTCTLVTHVLAVRGRAQRGGSGVGNVGDVLKLLELFKLAR